MQIKERKLTWYDNAGEREEDEDSWLEHGGRSASLAEERR